MKNMGLHEIRKEFLDFFKEKEHVILSSFSLVPKNDKSLLLINAGMAPLKPYFTGEKTPPSSRVATCQKCIRTGDIENVGKTDRHATFFEMLGNFSFGQYFKKEAIEWGWEFLTKRMAIPEKDLWVSIYFEDDEAYKIWNQVIGLDESKIIRLGKEDNFWELEVGPCGPCSEIYIDRGEKYGCGNKNCQPGCECDRFIEVWNLVFTQFDKNESGEYLPLEHPNIDTGMGLERIAAVLEEVNNIFEVKEIKKILNKVEKISGKKYGLDSKTDTSIRVITDHARAITFLVSDGVLPSNEGRGYVLRRLIRRAARHGKLLGIQEAFLNNIIEKVIDSWKVEYNEIKEKEDYIKKIVKAEEEKFQETIHHGIQILESYMEELEKTNESCLSGEKAFKLYDTYGFPLDLTKEILEEKGLNVDENGFNKHMDEQRKRARKARGELANSGWENNKLFKSIEGYESIFKGYDNMFLETEIAGISIDGNMVNSIEEGEEGIIILKETPFYAESGGQVGDIGYIERQDCIGKVIDTQYCGDETIIHFVKVQKGSFKVGNKVLATIDIKNRMDIMKNHSATHLLHKALKEILGEHVNQAGSIVLPNRLRFDFTHYEGVKEQELKQIEKIVNEKIFDALEVNTMEVPLEQSKKMGAIGLFDDKYKDLVRVVQMGNYTVELCGGTHVKNTSDIGLFKIISESSIASGIRRIEAITGRAVYEYLEELEEDMKHIGYTVKANRKEIVNKIENITEELKEKDKQINSLKSKMALSIVDEILNSKREINGINIITYKVNNIDMDSLRDLGDKIKNSLNTGVIVLASVADEKISFVSMATKDLIERGIHAGKIIKEVAEITGGGGGGRPDMAQAGGKDISKLEEALNRVAIIVERQVK